MFGPKKKSPVEVRESYIDYDPPVNFRKISEILLSTVPDKYFHALDCVVLTNYSGQPRRNRLGSLPSRKRKVRKQNVRGLYHSAWKGKRAWIEIYVDQIQLPSKRWWWFPMSLQLTLGQVLFHELGHHAHSLYPKHKEREDVADHWRDQFGANFFRVHYWYAMPILKVWRRLYLLSKGEGTTGGRGSSSLRSSE